MIAILQQCQRGEILQNLPSNIRSLAGQNITQETSTAFRHAVRNFVMSSEDPRILTLKTNFEEFQPGSIWSSHWDTLVQDRVWGDNIFLRSAAMILNTNIMVISTSSTDGNPWTHFEGRLNETETGRLNETETENGDCPDIFLGYTGNHYQSLLPVDPQSFTLPPSVVPQVSEKSAFSLPVPVELDFSVPRASNKSAAELKKEKDRERQRKYREKKQAQKHSASAEEVEDQKLEEKREQARKRKAESRARKKASNPEEFRENNKKEVMESRARKKASNPEEFKENQKKEKMVSRARQREKDEILLKINQNKWKQKSLDAHREENYPEVKTGQNQKTAKFRAKRVAQGWPTSVESGPFVFKRQKLESANDRLKQFREATMTGADYICVSCHIRCFKQSVVKLSESMEEKIDSNFPDEEWISDRNLVTRIQIQRENLKVPKSYKSTDDYCGDRFICNTCLRYLRKKKLPPCSVMNGLQLQETDQDLKDQNLMLTDLEAAMVSQRIIFQMIRLLPKSRWTALHDRAIMVPITDDAINTTLSKMPRTPTEAGLIGIKLKRKESFENTHMKQLVNPDKLFRFIQKAKDHGHPCYQNVGIIDESTKKEFQEKCRTSDKRGYELIYGDDLAEDLEELKLSESEEKLQDELEREEYEEEQDYIKNDPVKKTQFVYDETLALMDQHPEVTVSPGEGQRPISMVTDKYWDIPAYPHLFNPDGSGGMDQERKQKLTKQKFFRQRFLNLEMRFSKCIPYIYAATSDLEQSRLSSNISMVGRRGQRTETDGQVIIYFGTYNRS